MNLNEIFNQHPLITPQDISYNGEGLIIKGESVPCENPRLEYARALGHFKIHVSMHPRDGSWFAHNTQINFPKVKFGVGCVIGGMGFGYEYTEDGHIIPMPHLGNVVIEDGVALHNNVCIDRAVVGSTVIGAGSKIDNLVHVAHGVKIGKNCLIVSGVVFGGSVEVGDYCFIGMNASIRQKVRIGKNCVIGAGAVVTKDVPDGQIWIGNPAKYMKDTEPRKYKI